MTKITGRVFVDRFDSTEHITGKRRTYEAVKAAAIKAGRFSCFEATANQRNATYFTRLCRDPEVETFDLGFPWTGVRLTGVITNHDRGDEQP